MELYQIVLNNDEYLQTVKKIEGIKFITDGKWDWEHGLGRYKRVANYVKDILIQLNADERTIDLAMAAALLHDIGLSKGDKKDHAIESSKMIDRFLKNMDISSEELETLRHAIYDHSKGNDINSFIGLALVLADKLDVTYHRTINSSIKDEMNMEIMKIKNVGIKIIEDSLIVNYDTEPNFNVNILKGWSKAITIPEKIAKYLNKKYIFIVNDKEIEYTNF